MTNLLCSILVTIITRTNTIDNAIYAPDYSVVLTSNLSQTQQHPPKTPQRCIQPATEKTEIITAVERRELVFETHLEGLPKSILLTEKPVLETRTVFKLKQDWEKTGTTVIVDSLKTNSPFIVTNITIYQIK